MRDFAKIIVVDGIQVLFYFEPDSDEEDKSQLNQIALIDGFMGNVKLRGLEEDETVLLNKIEEEQARKVIEVIREFIKDDNGG